MSSQGRVGYKSKLAYGNGATPEVFTEIAEQLTLEPGDSVTEEVEFSNQDSVGFRKEFKPGWIDGGEMTVTGNYIPGNATQAQLRADRDSGTTRNWRINIRNPYTGVLDQTCTVAGWVKSFKPDTITPGEAILYTATIRCTGAETWA